MEQTFYNIKDKQSIELLSDSECTAVSGGWFGWPAGAGILIRVISRFF